MNRQTTPRSAAVITVSDSASAGGRDDTSGDEAERLIGTLGIESVERFTVPDDLGQIRSLLESLSREHISK